MSNQRIPPADEKEKDREADIAAEVARREIAREAAKHAVQLIKEQVAREDVERISRETADRIVAQAFKDVGIKLSNGGLDEARANWTWVGKRRKMEEEIVSQALKAVGIGLVGGLITLVAFYIRGNLS